MTSRTTATVLAFALATAVGASAGDVPAGEPLRGTRTMACGAQAKAPGVLHVVVTDRAKEPIPGATVTLVDPQAGDVIGKGVTGPDGAATFPGLDGTRVAFALAAIIGFHADGAEVTVGHGCETTLTLALPLAAIICDVEVVAEKPVADAPQN
jgi:hypothetical protein